MRSRRGIMLMELMVALLLLSVFTLISTKLFNSLLNVTRDAKRVEIVDRRRSKLLEMIRADVENAMEINAVSGKELVLRMPLERSVFWRIDAEGASLERVELIALQEVATESWDAVGGTLPNGFENREPGVRITWRKGAGDGGVVDLYSDLLRLEGTGR